MKRTRFIDEIIYWSIGPMWGVHSRWQTDAQKYIQNSERIIKAIRHNVKLCKKALKIKEQAAVEEFWKYQSKC
jgi:hypothetical protein